MLEIKSRLDEFAATTSSIDAKLDKILCVLPDLRAPECALPKWWPNDVPCNPFLAWCAQAPVPPDAMHQLAAAGNSCRGHDATQQEPELEQSPDKRVQLNVAEQNAPAVKCLRFDIHSDADIPLLVGDFWCSREYDCIDNAKGHAIDSIIAKHVQPEIKNLPIDWGVWSMLGSSPTAKVRKRFKETKEKNCSSDEKKQQNEFKVCPSEAVEEELDHQTIEFVNED